MTSLLVATELELHYNHKTFLDKLNFVLEDRNVVGLVGRNGCGKSSLLKILSNQIDYDGGKIEFKKNTKLGYLPQDFEMNLESTVVAQVLESSKWIVDLISEYNEIKIESQHKHDLFEQISKYQGWELEKHIVDLCQKFGVTMNDKKLGQLSGGESRRLALVCTLIGFPDILILDEPTNHLDLGAIEMLEKIIKNYSGAVLMVSHDRYFLDNVATKMWELHKGSFFVHNGGYTKYLENKATRMEIQNSADWKKQQFLKRELDWVRAGVKARGTKDKGRLKRFYELKSSGEMEQDLSVQMILPEPKPQGSRVMEVEKIYFEIEDKAIKTVKNKVQEISANSNQNNLARSIIHDFSFSFQSGQKIGILGNNGVGKTTFLNLLMSQILPTKGTIKTGVNTEFLYFDQKKTNLNLGKTPFDELGDGNEKFLFGDILVSTRKYLESWLFDRQKYDTTIKHLSGGEKSRLILAKILAKGGNFLILDEPTNDLDLDTLRVLEESLVEFEGTSLIVSHDRYFLNRVCNYIFAFEGNGAITISTGNYDQYLAKKIDPMLIKSYREALREKERQIKQAQKNTDNHLKKIESEIEQVETKIEDLKKPFDDPDFFIKEQNRAIKLHKMISDWERELERLMKKWEVLSSDDFDKEQVLNTNLTIDDVFIKPKPCLKQ